jgi:phosphonate transport system substrate-binding protein
MGAPKMKLRYLCLSLLFCAATLASAVAHGAGPSAEAPKRTYKFGVFPHIPLTELLKVYTPIAESFERGLGQPVELTTRPSYEQFADELRHEVYDIAFIQPFDYPMAHDEHHYLPIARRISPLSAIFIVLRGSRIHRLEDLRGKTIAEPSPNAAVTHLAKKALVDAGFDLQKDIKIVSGKNQIACMQLLLLGKADACATVRPALEQYGDPKALERFRIIYETPPVPHTLFVAHSRLSKQEIEKLQEIIVSWPYNAEGKAILAKGPLVPFVKALDAEYDPIRQFWDNQKSQRGK